MERIYELLKEVRPEVDFEKSDDYLEDGSLDSFDVMSLVELLEDTFDITIDGRDIVEENFKNAQAIRKLVEKYEGEL